VRRKENGERKVIPGFNECSFGIGIEKRGSATSGWGLNS
jgi:hypothetical protein